MRLRNFLKKSRRGNLIAILLFAVMISIMSMGTLAVASSLYTSNSETATYYANIQSYRSAAEIACYRYIMELQTVLVEKNVSAPVLGSTGPTIYGEAIDLIVQKIGKTEEPLTWKTATINDALTGTVMSDSTQLLNLMARLGGGRSEFKLYLDDYPEIDWTSGESYISAHEAQLRLVPFEVHVDLTIRGESLKEKLWIDGLRLLVTAETSGGSTDVTLKLVEREGGVQIYRD